MGYGIFWMYLNNPQWQKPGNRLGLFLSCYLKRNKSEPISYVFTGNGPYLVRWIVPRKNHQISGISKNWPWSQARDFLRANQQWWNILSKLIFTYIHHCLPSKNLDHEASIESIGSEYSPSPAFSLMMPWKFWDRAPIPLATFSVAHACSSRHHLGCVCARNERWKLRMFEQQHTCWMHDRFKEHENDYQ